MLEVKQYHKTSQNEWNQFVKNSKNGTFLFYRDFMEYHSDRFEDFSLLVYKKNKLIALLPANRVGNKVFSHQGLTYGGFILSKKVKFETVLEIVSQTLKYLEKQKILKLHLKLVPKIYNTYPSDEIDYLLFLLQAKLTRRDLSATIENKEALKIQSNRLEGVKKARSKGLTIEKTSEFDEFWKEILIPNLENTHQVKPVHSSEEIKLLAQKFPNHIQQYNVYDNLKIVGGATVFVTERVVHIQYISAESNKQQLGTLDFLFQHLIEEEFKDKVYFDFGTSNENQGLQINKGLLYWKECFGARSVIHDFYEVETRKHSLLNDIFI